VAGPRVDVSAAGFALLFQAVKTWGHWGVKDERGALNHLTADRVAAAAQLVRSGAAVSLSLPLNTVVAPDNPQPAEHHMTQLPDVQIGSGAVRFATDFVGVDDHNDGHTHIDATSPTTDSSTAGSRPASVTSRGAEFGAIDVLNDGLVGRGVLLDVPRLRGVSWLEPGEHVFLEDLEEAELTQGVTVRAGDVLLVRTGQARRLAEVEPWDTGRAKAGLHPTTVSLPGRTVRFRARVGRQQRHCPQQDRRR
jgi:hypothetical protein